MPQTPTASKGDASKFLAKYAKTAANAVSKFAGAETRTGPISLPAGIDGVAQITEIGFKELDATTKYKVNGDKIAKGEFHFQMKAVLLEPEFIELPDGRRKKVAGAQISKSIPFFDTKTQGGKVTTQEEHIDRILNEMRLLGGDDYTAGADVTALFGLAEGLNEIKPCFVFTTTVKAASKEINRDGSPKYPEGVWENWNGIRDLPPDYVPPDAASDAVDDDSGKKAVKQEEPTDEPADEPAEEPDAEASEDAGSGVDLDALFEAAENEDEEAGNKIMELAKLAGLDVKSKEVKEATWAELRQMIDEANANAGEQGDDEPAKTWKVKDTCQVLLPKDLKNPRKGKGLIDCVVVKADAKSGTAELKRLDTKEVLKGVKFEDMNEVE